MSAVRVQRAPARVWVLGRRWHHGMFGCVTLAVGVAQGSPLLMAAGAALICHDRTDRRRWLADLRAHPGARR